MNLKKTSPGCEVSQYIQEREKIFIEFITDEEIGSYWNVLKPKVKDVWVKEEAISTERLGMPCLMQKSFTELFMA